MFKIINLLYLHNPINYNLFSKSVTKIFVNYNIQTLYLKKNFIILVLFLLFQFSYSQPTNETVEAGTYFLIWPIVIEVGSTVTWINVGGLHDVNGPTNSITGNLLKSQKIFI